MMGNRPLSTPSLLPHPDDLGIPKSLVSTLVEVFYENAYNATLLVHKRLFLESLAAGTANPHIVLSVCAWAANFYRDQHGQAPLRDHGFMIEWAKKAGRLVFQEAENLHEDNIVTFCILALFWYSQGSWRLSQLHKGTACQLLHVIGLGSAKLRTENSWEAEIRRRRLWACYLMQCQSADNLSFFESIADVPDLTLPWPEEHFDQGISRYPPTCLKSGRSNGGIYAELVKALTLWSAVHSLVKSPETSMSERITGIHSLDEKISKWWQELPSELKLTTSNIAAVPLDALPKILLLNAVYHQSLCALHASIIPLFSWGSGDSSWSSARQCSAQVAFEQACAVSALIKAVLSTYTRLSAIPTFVAYAAYSGCAIQIPFMWCSNSTVKDRVHTNVRANIKMIQTVAAYWKFGALLQIHVGCLYNIHKTQPTILEDEPRHIEARKLTDFKINAAYARTSILGFIEILRPKGNGYINAGEESNDLGIQNAVVEDESQIPNLTLNNRVQGVEIAHRQGQQKGKDIGLELLPDSAMAQCHSQNPNQSIHPPFQPTTPPAPPQPNEDQYLSEEQPWHGHNQTELLFPTTSAQPQPPPNMLVTERLTLDACYPFFDQTMLDLFPNGEMPDLSQLEADIGSLDDLDLDGWNG